MSTLVECTRTSIGWNILDQFLKMSLQFIFFKEPKVKIKEKNRAHNKEQWPGKMFPEHYSIQDRTYFQARFHKTVPSYTYSIFYALCRLISAWGMNYYSFREPLVSGIWNHFYKIRFLLGTMWFVHLYKINLVGSEIAKVCKTELL